MPWQVVNRDLSHISGLLQIASQVKALMKCPGLSVIMMVADVVMPYMWNRCCCPMVSLEHYVWSFDGSAQTLCRTVKSSYLIQYLHNMHLLFINALWQCRTIPATPGSPSCCGQQWVIMHCLIIPVLIPPSYPPHLTGSPDPWDCPHEGWKQTPCHYWAKATSLEYQYFSLL